MRYKVFSFFSIAFFLIIIVFGCKKKTANANAPKPNPPILVDVLIAERQSITDEVEANGTVVPNEFLEIRSEVSGRLVALNIPEGSNVGQGAVLARVNDADLRATMAKIKVQLNLAQTTVSRYKKLLDINGLNQSDYDIALNQVNSFKADIAYTQTLIDKTFIRAPFSGVIGLRQVSPGAYVTPANILATLQQTSLVKIDFTLPQNYSNIIKRGDVVEVELDAATQQKTTAKIVAIEPSANTDTRNLKVRATLANADVNPGAFVKVIINAGVGKTSVMVPTNCIIPNDKSSQVIVVKNGLANFVDVKTGTREANAVEIVSGINVGDSVVVTGVLFARPKSKLQVRSVKKLNEMQGVDSTKN